VDNVNFEGGGIASANAPVIQFVSPTSTFAGSRTFSLRILGRNRPNLGLNAPGDSC